MNRIKTGDTVIITTGKSRGHVGKVLRVLPKHERVIVEGGNLIHKNVKRDPNKDEAGGIIVREAFLHVSNIALYNPLTQKADKIGFKWVEGTKGVRQKVRYFKSNDALVEETK